MKTELMEASTILEKEKNISRDVMIFFSFSRIANA